MFVHARTIVDRLVGLSAFLGALALVVATVVIIIDVTGRYFGAPLYGALDVVQMSAIFIVFGGMAYCDRRGGHITVDLLASSYSPSFNRWLNVAGYIAGAAIFALIAWQVIEASKLSVMLHMSTNILFLPRAPFQYALAAISAITSVSMLLRAIDLIADKEPGETGT